MPGRLAGKVAVVTGSGSGIGKAIAERLAQEGANLVVDYRDHIEEAQDTVDKITAAGGKSEVMTLAAGRDISGASSTTRYARSRRSRAPRARSGAASHTSSAG